jgi:hypothetical protein
MTNKLGITYVQYIEERTALMSVRYPSREACTEGLTNHAVEHRISLSDMFPVSLVCLT